MFISFIYLKQYKRMKINEFDSIRIDFTEPIQQVLGTNGCGKSSLFYELNPLAANAKEYGKEGIKHIGFTEKGHYYECVSHLNEGNKHSFTKDGVVIHNRVNSAVHNQTIKEYFGYTPMLRDLQLGKIRFTQMSVDKRREWFMMLPDIDFTYALSMYKRFKDAHRDITGSIKEAKRRMAQQLGHVMNDAERSKLQKEVHEIHNAISDMLNHRVNMTDSKEHYRLSHQKLYRELIALNHQTSQEIFSIKDNPYTSCEQAKEQLNHYLKQINTIKGQESTLNEQAHALQIKLKLYESSTPENIVALNNELEALQKQIHVILNTIYFNELSFTNPTESLQGFIAIESELLDLSYSLPNNSDRTYSQKNYTDLKTNFDLTTQKIVAIKEKIHKTKATIEHQLAHKEKDAINCPQCLYTWKLNFDQTTLDQNEDLLKTLLNELQALEVSKTGIESKLEDFSLYSALMRRYKSICMSRPDLECFWTYLAQLEVITHQPKQLAHLCAKVKEDLIKHEQLKNLKEKQNSLMDVLNLAKERAKEKNQDFSKELELRSNRLNELIFQRQALEAKYNECNLFISTYERIEKNYQKAQELFTQLQSYGQKELQAIGSELLTNYIRTLQSKLAIKEDMLSQANNHASILSDIKSHLFELETREHALSILIKQMSPSEGLIAEGVMGFMHHFVDQMNADIERIWSYPLVIESCQIDDSDSVDLDYRFPLRVAGDIEPISDVKFGSTAMQDIIDLVFIISAMRALKKDHYPMYLDEFSSSFDETHRASAVLLIQGLLDHYSFSQLFLISHYFTMHGSFSNTQICVLNDMNLSLSQSYNEHVQLNTPPTFNIAPKDA